jgi:serine/threonine-protein kinase RsbW
VSDTPDVISIRIPASPEYVSVVRLVVAGIASRLRFTIEDIEDLKIGVDELSAYLTGTQGREGTLEIRFSVHGDRIEVDGTGDLAASQKVRTELTEFSRMILDTVADTASLQQIDGHPSFKLVKSRAGA